MTTTVTWKDWAYLGATIIAYYVMTEGKVDDETILRIIWRTIKVCRWTRKRIMHMEDRLNREIDKILERGRTI